MLARLDQVLRRAQKGRYAVGAFNISNLEQIQAVVTAADLMQSPVIINVTEKAIAYADLDIISLIIRTYAKKLSIPIVLNLDHGRDLSIVRQCLGHGFTGIMYDGSRLSWTDNIHRTARVRIQAHAHGAGCEGELGLVKYPDEFKKDKQASMTDPEQAVEFVKQTKIDALAVAIGNAHGQPSANEHLDFDRLQRIRRLVSRPLVLHGASGTPPKDIKRAISNGICKINIDTDLRLAFSQTLRRTIKLHPGWIDPRALLLPSRDSLTNLVKQKIVLFKSHRQAK